MQAEWTEGGINYLRHAYPWFGVANTWYFRQVGDIDVDRSDYYFRAVDVEFTPRPLYRSLHELGDDLSFAAPGIHNDLAAPIRPLGTWSVVKAPDAIDGQYSAGSEGAKLIIRVEANEVFALLAPDQRDTTLIVRESGTSERERTFEIAAGQERAQLASWSVDQAPQRRTLDITVTGPEPLLLDGIDVRDSRSPRTLIAGGSALALILIAIFVLRRGTLV